MEQLFHDPDARQSLEKAYRSFSAYLASETWFDRASLNDDSLAVLAHHPVAYFCAEYGLVDWLPIYSGGLGVLAGDVLKEASDLGLPLVGVGLFYHEGFCHQRLNDDLYQTEFQTALDPATLPLSLVEDASSRPILVSIPLEGRFVSARVWRLDVGRVPLFLLDTNVPENEWPEDREITRTLYGGDQDTRIRQEIVLGIGGMRFLQAMGIEPALCSMNEGHAAFLGLELLRQGLENGDFEAARSYARSRSVYTNHTVVPAGNDVFPCELVSRYLGPYSEAGGIGVERLLDLARTNDDRFSMAVLAFRLSGKANGVSTAHAGVVRREWPGYEVEAVTNGVHVPTWLGSGMRALFDELMPSWRGDEPAWEKVQDIPLERLWHVHTQQRAALVNLVNSGRNGTPLDADVLTLVWARRFAEYKRAGLLATDVPRLATLAGSKGAPLQIVISGKAHPRDAGGKAMMQDLLRRLKDDTTLAQRSAFVEDYDLSIAAYLVQGADVWLNTPSKPLEASGTSGMKASDNGALQLTVEDGWAAEVDWDSVGWSLEGRDAGVDATAMYVYLEQEIAPLYYDRDENGVPREWVRMMQRSMVVTLSRYSMRRMLLEYVRKLYVPLLKERSSQTTGASL